MNPTRILREVGFDRELYIRASLMAMKKSELVHLLSRYGYSAVRGMTKRELVEQITNALLQWARAKDEELLQP